MTSFCETLSEDNQARLEAEGGVCIMYTHFACGFVSGGILNATAEHLLRAMAGRNGWFVPVSTLLDFLRTEHHSTEIPSAELRSMELRWALSKFKQLANDRVHAPGTADTSNLSLGQIDG